MSHGHSSALDIDATAARDVAQLMGALSTPSRVRILARLQAGPASVGELCDAVDMHQPAVSQQLRTLRQLGLVVGEREGRRVIYALHDEHIAQLLDEAVAHVAHLRLGLAVRPADLVVTS